MIYKTLHKNNKRLSNTNPKNAHVLQYVMK
jgi:hypothetical protein